MSHPPSARLGFIIIRNKWCACLVPKGTMGLENLARVAYSVDRIRSLMRVCLTYHAAIGPCGHAAGNQMSCLQHLLW